VAEVQHSLLLLSREQILRRAIFQALVIQYELVAQAASRRYGLNGTSLVVRPLNAEPALDFQLLSKR
jgi:hypothetical protein